MVIGILKELHFQRVSVVPNVVPKLEKLGCTVIIETLAGVNAGFNDEMYREKGVEIKDRAYILTHSDILLSIEPVSINEARQIKKGALYVSLFAPYQNPTIVETWSQIPIHVVSMDMIPRTTLAQSMDVLSSMASLAGYKAVIKACDHYTSIFPMMTTAAGTIPPTKVMVLGAGVAGLQAIATAKRLGAVVEAFDPRTAAKEEVLSLGANFVEVEGATDDRSAGGYAVQQSEDYLARQRALVQEKALKSNIIIATAQVRGKKAPLLITEDTINHMKVGSVIVDLASSTGGNCAFTEDNKTIVNKGVTIIGNSDLADELSQIASTMYANNIINFLQILIKEGSIHLNEENEIIKSALISKFL